MDTDDLTRAAYRVLLVRSGEVSEFLRSEIGTCAGCYGNEDKYLAAMGDFVADIAHNPQAWLDSWNLLDNLNPTTFCREVCGLGADP